MKASNQTAVAFQMKVANEILPSIRKTGSYSIKPKPMMIEDVLIEQLQAMKEVKLTQQQQATAIAAPRIQTGRHRPKGHERNYPNYPGAKANSRRCKSQSFRHRPTGNVPTNLRRHEKAFRDPKLPGSEAVGSDQGV